MTDLITRLGAATGPDRGLDAEIAEACGWRHSPWGTWVIPPGDCVLYALPAFTGSVDAALTLVPEGLRIGMQIHPTLSSGAYLRTGSILDAATKEWEGNHKITAVALCIAALRARSGGAGG